MLATKQVERQKKPQVDTSWLEFDEKEPARKTRTVQAFHSVGITPLAEGYRLIPHDLIERWAEQPRVVIDKAEIRELQDNILDSRAAGGGLEGTGLEEPLTVRPHPGDETKYLLIDGERRWQATDGTAVHELPCIIRPITRDGEALEVALIKALQREDLSPVEEGYALERWMSGENRDGVKVSYRDACKRLGKKKGWLENRIAITHAPEDVQEMVSVRTDTIIHAREITRVEDTRLRRQLIQQTLQGASVEAIKARVDEILEKPRRTQPQVTQGRIIEFPAPRPSIEGSGFVVPEDSAIERHAATVAQSTPITGGHAQGTFAPRQPQIDPVDLMLKVCSGAQAVAAALPSLMNREHLYKTELRTLVAQTRAALDEIERAGQGQK